MRQTETHVSCFAHAYGVIRISTLRKLPRCSHALAFTSSVRSASRAIVARAAVTVWKLSGKNWQDAPGKAVSATLAARFHTLSTCELQAVKTRTMLSLGAMYERSAYQNGCDQLRANLHSSESTGVAPRTIPWAAANLVKIILWTSPDFPKDSDRCECSSPARPSYQTTRC